MVRGMATKKSARRLTPIPRQKKRNPEIGAAAADAPPATPDPSRIVEGLRPLAVSVTELKFDPENAMKHGEENLDAIKGSLESYGQRKPVVVNRRTGFVEAGNGTLAAALALGWTHLAALYVDDDDDTATGYAIADNRTAQLSTWVKEKLDQAVAKLKPVKKNPRIEAMLAKLSKSAPAATPARQPENVAFQAGVKEKAKLTCPKCGHQFDAAE